MPRNIPSLIFLSDIIVALIFGLLVVTYLGPCVTPLRYLLTLVLEIRVGFPLARLFGLGVGLLLGT